MKEHEVSISHVNEVKRAALFLEKYKKEKVPTDTVTIKIPKFNTTITVREEVFRERGLDYYVKLIDKIKIDE
ncbi:MAG TPA: hypothetical protein VIK77_02660 [Tissierellaceae bacterium]